jgi:hypothetical protein
VSLAHAPYADGHKPFAIGLAPLDLADWIEPDERLSADLAEKDRLFAERRAIVFAAEPDTVEAQQEVLELLVSHLTERFPQTWRAEPDGTVTVAGGRRVDPAADPDAPLLAAARLVQEDLVLMRRGPDGWRLAAAALCFPSAWSLTEKFGASLDGLHGNVPGYAGAMGARMARIFDSLRLEHPVWRLNWSIYPDDRLHHPESKEQPRAWFGSADDLAAAAFVRVERQTLRRLPASGDILFTIRIHVDPMRAFRSHPDGARMATGLRDRLLALDTAQLAYKGLTAHRDRLAEALERIAAGS